MTDLCLINPPHPYLVSPHAQAPLGLLYVAAAAENAGLDVRIANMAGFVDCSIAAVPPASIYGFTGTHLDIAAIHDMAAKLKARDAGCRIVVGGPASLSDTLESPDIDAIFHGEAEGHVAEIMGPSDRHVYCTPVATEELPRPARHLWSGPFGGNVFVDRKNFFGSGSTTIMSSRGCPHSCAFCASAALCDRKVRITDPCAVVAEMEDCVQRYGVRQFRFSDEFFTAKRSHVHAVCDGIRASRVLGHGDGVAWRASVAVKPHDLDTYKTMAAAGCREVAFGVETADPFVLGRITKKGSVQDAYDALSTAKRAGLQTRALMMTGLPYESISSYWANVRFFAKAEFDALALAVFTPLPGCAIAERPADFDCEILPEQQDKSVCLFGRDGSIDASPRIRNRDMNDLEFGLVIERTITAAMATHRLGRG